MSSGFMMLSCGQVQAKAQRDGHARREGVGIGARRLLPQRQDKRATRVTDGSVGLESTEKGPALSAA